MSDGQLSDLLAAVNFAGLRSIDEVDQTFPANTAWAEPHLRQLKAIADERDVVFIASEANIPELLVISLNRSRSDIGEFIASTRYGDEDKVALHHFVSQPPP